MATCIKIEEEIQKSSSELQCSQEITEVLSMLQNCRLRYYGSGMQEVAGGDGKCVWGSRRWWVLFESFSLGL